MKRDFNLMRQIMLDLEKLPYIQNDISDIWKDRTPEEYQRISLRVQLLADSKYIVLGSCLLGCGFENFYIQRITNDGYTFLDYARNDTVWQKLYPKFAKLGSIALRIIEPIATEYLRRQL